MALTSPDNIFSPDAGDDYALTADLAAVADSVQLAITTRFDDLGPQELYSYRWANSTERGAETGMRAGDSGCQVDTGVKYRYSGSAWQPLNPYVSFRKATAQSLTSGTEATLTLDSSPTDILGTWTMSSGVITMPLAGSVIVTSQALFEAGGSPTLYQLRVTKNGATNAVLTSSKGPTEGRYCLASGILRVAAGDTLRVTAFQNSGANRTVGELNSEAPIITLQYVGQS